MSADNYFYAAYAALFTMLFEHFPLEMPNSVFMKFLVALSCSIICVFL